ncbi:uncharacterized protein BO97DRAFT_450930 [Aspergillus homomorphus CBS 101889]|uniref:Uncharacterized protein n=1 Tax=Aspergillus homomorphus (strain CBS 101889) TaxID=1450537 RepID=A0A395HY98_ASPHC|nr:hypothetical protein BO97DRAFT_450930 [Aspergillus homomorphus CBS 101889]RAL12912.1 hypothetical protein BO97DRAFT_450930 [Aspergillus homomorphus CBS 101889]
MDITSHWPRRAASTTFAYGDRREPILPKPYIKNPNQYPPTVNAEYHEHKDEVLKIKGKKEAVIPTKEASYIKCRNEEKLEAGIELNQALRHQANLAGAMRAGFAHKYPTAYENEEAIKGHEMAVTHTKNTAKAARKNEA